MIIFPAIDIKDGDCVRLLKGEMNRATVFNKDPAAQAVLFKKQGFNFLHLVDLNGAFEGRPVNTKAVEAILEAVDVNLQLGGGIRTMQVIDHWLGVGIKRVILGTAALKDPKLVQEACNKYPGQIVVGIDARDGKVAVEGWSSTSEVLVEDLAKSFENVGVAAIIYTDINRDGIMVGPDIKGISHLLDNVNIPVIASGGISSNKDIEMLKTLEVNGLEGIITGRALYEEKIDIKQALRLAEVGFSS